MEEDDLELLEKQDTEQTNATHTVSFVYSPQLPSKAGIYSKNENTTLPKSIESVLGKMKIAGIPTKPAYTQTNTSYGLISVECITDDCDCGDCGNSDCPATDCW